MQKAAQIENPFEIESAAVSDRGLNESRPHNEDSYLDQPEFGIFGVADGVGGAQAGEVASQMAVEILGEAFGNMPENADPEAVMRAAFSKANEAIFEMSSQLRSLSKMATTIAALHLKGDVATVGHVGDSRIYRFMPDGRVVQETLDHSIVAEEVRAGRMTEEQAATHPSRNIISRALGAEPSVEIDLKTIMVEPGTTFLLCSDGITRHVNEEEMLSALRSGGSTSNACAILKDLCYERGAEDNLTAVVVRVGTLDYIGDSSHEIPFLDDDQEDTLASPRFGYSENGRSEVELTPAARFDIVDDEPETIEFAPEPAEDEVEPKVEKEGQPDAFVSARPQPSGGAVQPLPAASQPREERFHYTSDDPITNPSNLSKILGAIILLLIGVGTGVGGYYFWNSSKPPVASVQAPIINEEKSSNIPLTAFEESRRLVDQDPRKYIAANQNPQDAQDFFLLGRAYLLTGEYFQAKNAFNSARSRIDEIDERDRQTIANEINMALAIIANGPATERFSQSVSNSANTGTSNSVIH
jgi:serine/threonine protein phosphatase PrpC